MKFIRWLPIAAPAVLGLIIGLVLNLSGAPNPVLYMRADLGTLIFLASLGISVLAEIALLVWDWNDRVRLKTRVQALEDRRLFLQRLDHELKNPLTAILAGLANLSIEADQSQTEVLGSIDAQIKRLRTLISNLRKLSNLEFLAIERSPVNISDLLEDIVTISKDQTQAADRKLNLSIPQAPWPLPDILGDRDLLVLAVHNLLDNAIKFTKPEDTIEVRAFEDQNSVIIEVADTGPGIPENESSHIWQELYRGQAARGIPGSGLGLALVRLIVAQHGGAVSLRSRPGQGTVFSIRLPAG